MGLLLLTWGFVLSFSECNCSDEGAVDNICNHVTGQCTCQPYVTGLTCGTCEQNAYNYTRAGCMPCNCDDDGSIDLQCHEVGWVPPDSYQQGTGGLCFSPSRGGLGLYLLCTAGIDPSLASPC